MNSVVLQWFSIQAITIMLYILYKCVYKYIYIYMYRLPSSPYPPPVPGCGGPASVGTPKPGTWKPFVTLYIYVIYIGPKACL